MNVASLHLFLLELMGMGNDTQVLNTYGMNLDESSVRLISLQEESVIFGSGAARSNERPFHVLSSQPKLRFPC
jgi:hypothetical protein